MFSDPGILPNVRPSSTSSVRGNDDRRTDEFFLNFAKNNDSEQIKKEQSLAFIVVCHIVPTLPYYLRALEHFGEIVCLIPKGHGAEANRDPSIFRVIKQDYPLMEDVNRETLNSKEKLNDFLEKKLKYNSEENKEVQYVIIDEGGYFTNHPLPDEFNKKLLGIVETTENGHQRYEKEIKKETNPIKVPVFSIARTKLKAVEDAFVGKSIVYATETELRLSNTTIERFKNVGVMGFGKIGQSTASTLWNNMQVKPVIFEPNSLRAIKAQKYDVIENKNKEGDGLPPVYDLSKYDLLFCTTGVGSIREDVFKTLRDNVFIASCTSREDEFRLDWLNDAANATVKKDGNYTVYTLTESKKTINFVNHGNSANFLYNAVEGPSIYLVFATTISSILNLAKTKYEVGKIHELDKIEQAKLASLWLDYYVISKGENGLKPIVTETDFSGLLSSFDIMIKRKLEDFKALKGSTVVAKQPMVKSKSTSEYVGVSVSTGMTFQEANEHEYVQGVNQLALVIDNLSKGTIAILSAVKNRNLRAGMKDASAALLADINATNDHMIKMAEKNPDRNFEYNKKYTGLKIGLFERKEDSTSKKEDRISKKESKTSKDDVLETGSKL